MGVLCAKSPIGGRCSFKVQGHLHGDEKLT